MYSISEAYRTKMFDNVQTHKLTGTIHQDYGFSDADVIGVSYTNQCSDKKVALGSVNIGVLKLTFLKDILNRGDYYDKKIVISDSLLTGYDENEDPIWEAVPIGEFFVGDAVHTGPDMVDITAYDCLSKMDKILEISQTSGYLYDFCTAIARDTGTTFGMTQEEVIALPNSTVIIGPYPDNDMSTYRDMLSKLAQMIGGFAYADRDGTWKLKSFNRTSVLSVPKDRRFSGSKFSDYQTRFDGVSYDDVKTTGETRYVGDPNGFIMELGNNPFLQYGTGSFVTDRVNEIFSVVQDMRYTPFEVTLLPAFIALDLGDVLSFVGDYTSDTTSGALMKMTWTYNKSLKVQCFGSNPNLRKGQSSTDHAIRGASSANREGRLVTYLSTNIQSFNISSTKERILSTLFSTSSTQAMLTLTEIKFDLDSPGTVEVFYVLDDEEILYVPKETYGEAGTHTISLMYPLQVDEINIRHRFDVKIRSSSNLTIDPECARLYVQGTGYNNANDFDGYIEARDDFTEVGFGYMQPIPLTDSLVIQADIHNDDYTVSDSFSEASFSALSLVSMSDTASLYMETGFNRITEDGNDRVTEEDEYNRITE